MRGCVCARNRFVIHCVHICLNSYIVRLCNNNNILLSFPFPIAAELNKTLLNSNEMQTDVLIYSRAMYISIKKIYTVVWKSS